jgi:hypothetical protein
MSELGIGNHHNGVLIAVMVTQIMVMDRRAVRLEEVDLQKKATQRREDKVRLLAMGYINIRIMDQHTVDPRRKLNHLPRSHQSESDCQRS